MADFVSKIATGPPVAVKETQRKINSCICIPVFIMNGVDICNRHEKAYSFTWAATRRP